MLNQQSACNILLVTEAWLVVASLDLLYCIHHYSASLLVPWLRLCIEAASPTTTLPVHD